MMTAKNTVDKMKTIAQILTLGFLLALPFLLTGFFVLNQAEKDLRQDQVKNAHAVCEYMSRYPNEHSQNSCGVALAQINAEYICTGATLTNCKVEIR